MSIKGRVWMGSLTALASALFGFSLTAAVATSSVLLAVVGGSHVQ